MNRDFETHPLGTGAELARLSDLVQELGAALKAVMPYAENECESLLEIEDRDGEDCGSLAATQALESAETALAKAGL